MPTESVEEMFDVRMGPFGGSPRLVTLRVYSIAESRKILLDPHKRREFYEEGEGPLRGAPLLSVHLDRSDGASPRIAVGRIVVRHPEGELPLLRVLISDAWEPVNYETVGSSGTSEWRPVDGDVVARDAVMNIANTAIVAEASDDDKNVTLIAKAFAEGALEAMTLLQNLRQARERAIAEVLRVGSNKAVESGLSDLVILSLISGMIRHEAASAHRQIMFSYFTANDQYAAVRRLQDPTLMERPREAEARTKPGFVQLDAAVRLCGQLVASADAEMRRLDGLVAIASTVTSARDTRLQEEFNQVATIGSVVIAIPALLFTFYGADTILPLDPSLLAVTAPIIFSIVVGMVVALLLPAPSRSQRFKRALIAGSALAATTLVLAVAGIFVPNS